MTSPTRTPPLPPLFAVKKRDDLSSHLHRQLIGILGLALPPLIWIVAGLRPTLGLYTWENLDSVSAYYYSGAVSAFVGILFALAVFLFTYRGYDNEDKRRDRWAASIAGLAAIGVAFFPTQAPEHVQAPLWWTPAMRTIHYASAVTLFVSFIFFSLVLFPKARPAKGKSLPSVKRRRNYIYRSCGAAMIACILWAGSAPFTGAPIFWPESLALEFFAVSWLVKGHADWTAVNLGRRVLHYGRHPGQLAEVVRKAVRTRP